jgi:cytochrome c oxidase assembly protein subunit 15
MVKSGLTGDSVYVKPVKLALHFVFALGLICYAWWFALQLSVPANQIIKSHSIRKWTRLVIVILFFQLIYGALMAGHKAANAASTWPTINGSWLPADSFSSLVKIVDNKITIHFIHRGLAYLLLFFTILWTFGAIKANPVSGYFSKTRWLPFILIMAQVILGVMAVLSSTSIVANHWGPFEWIAQAHQVIGMLYLLLMVWMLYIVRAEKYPV